MSTLRERNLKIVQKIIDTNEGSNEIHEQIKARYGFDTKDAAKFPVLKEGFKWSAVKKKLFKESDVSSAFTQFLRAGVQNITNAAYQATPTTYEDWVTVVQSKLDTELYAPNHGVAMPRQVGPNERFPEVGAAALDIKLQNRGFGAIYSLSKYLLEDDQTGSFQAQAGYLGEYMKIVHEVYVYGKLASVSGMKYIDLSIPLSETKPSAETNYPWSISLQGGGANRPSAYGALSQANIQSGLIGLMNQKNLQGIKMLVDPKRLLVGPAKQFDAALLLNSSFYPSGAATSGNVGGAFAINPIKGVVDLTVSRFIFKNDGTVNGDSTAWFLMDDKKPWFILQIRDAVTVEQESPNAGISFDTNVFRYKAQSRFNSDHIDPRFAWQGSDGSA